MRDRDYAKRAAVKNSRELVLRELEDVMRRKGKSYAELAGLLDVKEHEILKLVRIDGLAKALFELGYELTLTAVPMNRERLRELASQGFTES